MPTGTVKWYNASKGFGFIMPDGGGADLFLHRTALEAAGLSPPQDGQRLSYALGADPQRGRPIAVDITKLE